MMEEESKEGNSINETVNKILDKINPFWGLITIGIAIGGFGFWIGSLTTKYEYLQLVNEKSLEYQKKEQELKSELLKSQIDFKILEAKSEKEK